MKQATMFWGSLIHLSYNMWSDIPLKAGERRTPGLARIAPELEFDLPLWHDLTEHMATSGFNAVVIDIGDGVRFDSHPEIAVRNAWSPRQLRSELARLRRMGLEPLPKLNFSAAHDGWLKEYGRMVSTDRYYEVCRNLIQEVAELFDTPRFFHLGMDEELASMQAGTHHHIVVRKGDLWWHDLHFLAEYVTRNGSRPWVWADFAWHDAAAFYKRMPREILQSNWWYGLWFEADESRRPRNLHEVNEGFLTYLDLAEHGFEQIPTATTWHNRFDNFPMTVEFCTKRLKQEGVLGFLQTTWQLTTEEHRAEHFRSIDIVAQAIRDYEAGKYD